MPIWQFQKIDFSEIIETTFSLETLYQQGFQRTKFFNVWTVVIAFKNGIVEVNKDKIGFKSYSEAGKYIWQNHIIPFEISLIILLFVIQSILNF
jgi:hypothetical protein